MRRPFAAVAVLGTAAAVFSLAGCGSSTAPSGTSFKSLSPAQQASFEQAAVTEVEADISSFTSLTPYALFGFDRVAAKRFTGSFQMAHLKRTPLFQTGSSCVTETPANPVDTDGDGVVDTLTETFNCSNSGGGITETITGTFSLGDPTPTVADVDIADGANLTLAETGSSVGTVNLTLAGNSQVTQGSGAIDEQGSWALNEQLSNNPNNDNGTFKLGATETATYTYGGAALTSFGSLPPGTFSVSGNWSYVVQTSKLNVNLSFSVSTPTALSINQQSCTANSSGIQSGEVDIKFNDGTVVKAVWASCPSTPSITVT